MDPSNRKRRPASVELLRRREVKDVTLEILGEGRGVARLTLNVPERMNALSMGMLRNMHDALDEHFPSSAAATKGGRGEGGEEEEEEPRLLVMRGTGGKAFCAGGDVRDIVESKSLGPGVPGTLRSDFFREEYRLDYRLARIGEKKASLAIWDGVVMGGGVGISVHASFRVATEKTTFAMPETMIGIFPDVGASYVLSRLPGGLGPYIGLTGARLKADDLLHCGLATHMVPRASLDDLQAALVSDDGQDAGKVLGQFSAGGSAEQSTIVKSRVWIDEAFQGSSSVEEIIRRLEARASGQGPADRVVGGISEEERRSGQEWAAKALDILRRASPTALKVAHRHIAWAAGHDIRRCYEQDFRLVQHLMVSTDFGEGVRALLIDKDNKPAWRPPTLEGVTEDVLESIFAGIGDHELDLSSE